MGVWRDGTGIHLDVVLQSCNAPCGKLTLGSRRDRSNGIPERKHRKGIKKHRTIKPSNHQTRTVAIGFNLRHRTLPPRPSDMDRNTTTGPPTTCDECGGGGGDAAVLKVWCGVSRTVGQDQVQYDGRVRRLCAPCRAVVLVRGTVGVVLPFNNGPDYRHQLEAYYKGTL